MMSEIEDGEILSDEGEDVTKTADSNPLEVYNVTTRPERTQKPFETSGYRGTNVNEISYSDEDSVLGESSSDEDSPVAKKQPRTGSLSCNDGPKYGYKKDSQWLAKAHKQVLTQKGKKVNNIWGSVIQEEDMSKFVSQLNRNDAISYEERGAESYDYTQARTDTRFNENMSSEEVSLESSEEEQGPADLTEKETFGFVVDKQKKKGIKERLGSKPEDESDKSECSLEELYQETGNVKSRLGHRQQDQSGDKEEIADKLLKKKGVKIRHRKNKSGKLNKKGENDSCMEVDMKTGEACNKNSSNRTQKNRAKKRTFNNRNNKKGGFDDVEVKEMKRIQLNEAMDDMELVDTFLDALREPQDQTDLFLKILDELGRDKMLKLFKATEDIEDMGGLMIQNGSRRRTPGGVFLLLVRKDADITKDQLDAIFAHQNSVYLQKRKEQRKERKKITRRLKREEKFREQKARLSAMETGEMTETVVDNGQAKANTESSEKVAEENTAKDEGELDNEELIDIQLE